MICLRFNHAAPAAIALGTVLAAAPCQAQSLDKLTVLIFAPPSLSAFMPPVIKARKLDQANGLDLTF